MQKILKRSLFLILILLSTAFADDFSRFQASTPLIPKQPNLPVKAFILIDADSGRILAQRAATTAFEPASLTKLMSLLVISNALHSHQIHLSDQVLVSTHAWHQKGSRMFIKAGDHVPVNQLLQGIIVASGNDATMAMAEHTAGSEEGFVDLMNYAADKLRLSQTHFVNPTGMPAESHRSSAKDLSTIARTLIHNYPEFYHWYHQKWFSYHHIRQPNRNRLLWRDHSVDGLKTGHTQSAGYCLVSSAKQNGMRLIAVVMGAKTDAERNASSQRLLNYGFRFYTTQKLMPKAAKFASVTTYKGQQRETKVGLLKPLYLTFPKGFSKKLKITKQLPESIIAPVARHTKLGELRVSLGNQLIAQAPLVALQANANGSRWQNMVDTVRIWFGG